MAAGQLLGAAGRAAPAAVGVVASLTTGVVVQGISATSPGRGAALAGVAGALAAAAAVDVRTHRLPNRWLGAAALCAVAGAVATAGAMTPRRLVTGALTALGGALLGGTPMLGARLTRSGPSVGMGDVKAAGVIGASTVWLAWWAPWVGLAVAASLAASFGLATRRSQVALGPFLVTGWMVAVSAALVVSAGAPS